MRNWRGLFLAALTAALAACERPPLCDAVRPVMLPPAIAADLVAADRDTAVTIYANNAALSVCGVPSSG